METQNKRIDVDHIKDSCADIAGQLRVLDEVKESGLPKGYTCDCGKFIEFGPYVYAHWDVELVGSCIDCGARARILRGQKIRENTSYVIAKYVEK